MDLSGKFIPALCSHKTVEWSTPQDFYDKLNQKYHFTLDVASTHQNAKCIKHYTLEDNGLKQPWEPENFDENTPGAVWCNPPYGSGIGDWVQKAIECKNKVVMFLPVRTSTPTFHNLIIPNGKTMVIKGRLKFGGLNNTAPYDSMLVEFN
jgi:site-specific DNA-methyltransferase (adenine-specific)